MKESRSRFQVGGNLSQDALYVRRAADGELERDLQKGLLRCVLAPRQSGKTSLATRTIASLRRAGVCCARVDLSGIGTCGVRDSAHWSAAVLAELHAKLCPNDSPGEFRQLWQRSRGAPLSSRCIDYFRTMLARVPGLLLCFFDEVDAVLSLSEGISADDLFAAVRTLHDERDQTPDLARLNFCLLGVASAGELMQDVRRTPFNVAQEFTLSDFEYDEAAPAFRSALRQHGVSHAEARFDEVFAWTSGHPYLTHLLCKELAVFPGESVDALVERLCLRPGQTLNPNLQQAEERLDRRIGRDRTAEMLRIYREVLSGHVVAGQRTSRAQDELYLCGLCRWKDGSLVVRNRVYTTVFGLRWVEERQEFGGGYGWFDQNLDRWLRSGRQPGFLLRGSWLNEAQAWAERHELTADQQTFLMESLAAKAADALARTQRRLDVARAEKRLLFGLSLALFILILGGAFSAWRISLANKSILAVERQAREFAEERERANAGKLLLEKERASALALAKRKSEESLLSGQRLLKLEKERADALALAKQKSDESLKLAKGRADALALAKQKSEESLLFAEDRRIAAEHGARAEAELREKTELLLQREQQEKQRIEISAKVALYQETARGLQFEMLRGEAHYDAVLKSIQIVHAGLMLTRKDGSHLLQQADRSQREVVRQAAESVHANLLPLVSHRLEHQHQVWSAAFAPTGARFATASADGQVAVWDLRTSSRLSRVTAHRNNVVNVGFSADGTQLFTCGRDASVRIWRIPQNGMIIEKSAGVLEQRYAKHGQWAAAFSPDGSTIATVGDRGTASLWNLKDRRRLRVFECDLAFYREDTQQELSLYTVAYSSNGKLIAAGGNDSKVRVWDVATGRPLWSREHHHGEVKAVAFSPQGDVLASGGTDQKVLLWDVPTGVLHRELGPRQGPVTALAFSKDGRLLADATQTGHVRIADALTDVQTLAFYPHRDVVRAIAFAPHETGLLLTASLDGSAQIHPITLAGYLNFACQSLRSDAVQYKRVEAECRQDVEARSAN